MDLSTARSLRSAGRHDEARTLLVELAAHQPASAELQFEAACVHDFLGLEAAAVPYYMRAIAHGDGLTQEQLCSAYLGLGSTLRCLGRFGEADEAFRTGLERFPDAHGLAVFRAMAQHNLGQSKAAIEALLALLARTSSDPGILSYREAIAFYARDIDRTWPD
jgi:tetratricopeptide (TPR) repeat protein